MKKRTFILQPHSVIDVITNSSTELFIMDGSQTVDAINEILKDFYDKNPYIPTKIWAEEEPITWNYSVMDFFGFYGVEDLIEKLNGLQKLGFKLTEEQEKWMKNLESDKEEDIPKVIVISHSRDDFDDALSCFISETFGVHHHDTDA